MRSAAAVFSFLQPEELPSLRMRGAVAVFSFLQPDDELPSVGPECSKPSPHSHVKKLFLCLGLHGIASTSCTYGILQSYNVVHRCGNIPVVLISLRIGTT